MSPVMPSASERALARLGALVREKYRIVRLLGVGGMAAVYAAVDLDGRRVAIKFLHERLADDPVMVRLFDREAHTSNQIEHPGAVPVLESGIDANGCAFLVMPLLYGETLRQRWERANKRLPLIDVGVFLSDVLDVLACAHDKGIIHRDIKPENLFVTSSGDVRVLDFGIARRTDSTGTATVTGGIIGTPAFMPPEQAVADRDAIGPPSDCWAMGATLFTLLSGEFVHPADSGPAQLAAAITRRARSLAEVAPDMAPAIVQFVDKSLAFEPKDRWRSAREMREALLRAFEEALGTPLEDVALRVRANLIAELTLGAESADLDTELPLRASHPPPINNSSTKAGLAKSLRRKGLGGHRTPVLAGAVALGIAASVAAFRHDRHERSAVDSVGSAALSAASAAPAQVVERDAGEPANPRALAHLRGGIQNWRDGSVFAAQQDFDRASELDPSLGEAHLYAMLLLNDEETMREEYRGALAHRDRLGPRDRALLDAFADAMTVPWNLNAAAERLFAVKKEFPSDWMVLATLSGLLVMSGRSAEAFAVLDELLYLDPLLGLGWSDKAEAFAVMGDASGARASLQECVRLAATADACLDQLMLFDMSEGRCAEAEQSGRKLMATPLAPKWWGLRLADSIYGRGGSLESVHNVLEQQWRLASPAEREVTRLKSEARFHVLAGNFAEVERSLDAWGELIASKKYEIDHVPVESLRLSLAMELGDRHRAARLAARFLSQRDSLLASHFDWEIVPLRTQYLAGGMSREAFEARRQKWLERMASRPPLQEEINSRWTEAYGHAAVTHLDAVAALRALPKNPPTWDLLRQEPEDELAIGRVYFLTGDTAKAVQYLGHGARRCQALRRPFEHTWLHLHLGAALERAGDIPGACAAYDVVLTRWGKEPRSVSAKTARARHAALHCPPR
ncbi:protein kinase domain-containing protein [Pendulispora albinea]|uniref:Serine/threonine protein kinase n=1 Tax=Pendulispora albinea TaxID=2741071 RepID=A0ABZ2LQA3_9BACT